MAYLFLGIAGLALLYFAARWFAQADPRRIVQGLGMAATVAAGLVVIVLALTGRLNVVLGLVGALAPLALWALRQRRLGGVFADPEAQPQEARSEVRTAWLRMSLDHASGAMDGAVLQGRFAGRRLADLDAAALLSLLGDCAADGDSQRLLEAYLDRRLGAGWRADAGRADGAGRGEGAAGGAAAGGFNGNMSRAQAYAVLGLEPGADAEAIRAAHRRLMAQLHPDRGGSSFLAAQINRAKDVLLGGK